jgi:hypothetical protein
LATDLTWSGNRTEHGANDVARKPAGLSFELGDRGLLILIHDGARLLDLILPSGASLIHGFAAGLRGSLAAVFHVAKNFLARFAQALLVLSGAGLGSGYIGAGFLHCALRASAAFGEDGHQRPMQKESIESVQSGQQDDRRHRSEQ